MDYWCNFGMEFEKTFLMFEIGALEFVLMQTLVQK